MYEVTVIYPPISEICHQLMQLTTVADPDDAHQHNISCLHNVSAYLK